MIEQPKPLVIVIRLFLFGIQKQFREPLWLCKRVPFGRVGYHGNLLVVFGVSCVKFCM